MSKANCDRLIRTAGPAIDARIVVALLGCVVLGLQTALCQNEWVRYQDNPVLGLSESGWDNGSIVAASVLKEGELYKMWYSASNSTRSGIGLALSADGVHWGKHLSNPLILNGPQAYDDDFLFAPTVVREESGYKMWYTGSDPSNIWTIELATSPDGVVWTKHPANPVLTPGPGWYDGERVGDPCVILDEGIYKMWYTCQNRPNITYAIAYATSPDGVVWTKHPQNPVLLPGQQGPDSGTVRDPCVLRMPSGYQMWYRGIDGGNWTICHATSQDGILWTRDEDNPVLSGEPGAWDKRVWFPNIVMEPNRYSMWYVSADANEVGYAYLPIPEVLTVAAFALTGLTTVIMGTGRPGT